MMEMKPAMVAATMRQDLRQEWNENELRLAVLQVLLGARKISPQHGGATGKQLMDALQVDNVRAMEATIWYLRDKELLSTGEKVFQITANGVDYVEQHWPDCTPFSIFSEQEEPPPSTSGQDPPPWSPEDGPGPWPPRRDPDDPSKVPKNRKPSGSAGEIALPLPDPDQYSEPQP
jgi:hypothetical protein